MCSVTQHQCRRRQMFGKCSQIQPVHSLFVRYKKTTCPDWIIYSWQGFNSLGCPLMLWTNYRCFKSFNISVYVAKCVENVHTLHSLHSLWTVTKNDLSSLNNLSSNSLGCRLMSKNELQMCLVTQHQCRCRQMCGKCSQIHCSVDTHFLSVTKNDLSWFNNLFMESFLLI